MNFCENVLEKKSGRHETPGRCETSKSMVIERINNERKQININGVK